MCIMFLVERVIESSSFFLSFKIQLKQVQAATRSLQENINELRLRIASVLPILALFAN